MAMIDLQLPSSDWDRAKEVTSKRHVAEVAALTWLNVRCAAVATNFG